MSRYKLTFKTNDKKQNDIFFPRRQSIFRSFLDFPPIPCYNMRASRCVGIGRRGGLKILWANNPCGFDPRHRHQQGRLPIRGAPLLLPIACSRPAVFRAACGEKYQAAAIRYGFPFFFVGRQQRVAAPAPRRPPPPALVSINDLARPPRGVAPLLLLIARGRPAVFRAACGVEYQVAAIRYGFPFFLSGGSSG